MQTLKVDVGHTTYPIKIGAGLLGDGELLESLIPGGDVCVVTNTTVGELYLAKLQTTLAATRGAVFLVADPRGDARQKAGQQSEGQRKDGQQRESQQRDAQRNDGQRRAAPRIVSCVLPDGEQFKTLETVGQVIDALVGNRLNRDCTLLALGGGVVGDIAGFAAACYQRGVGYLQIPTTLLAQVDSSVGGKTGVNHPGGKNLIGAFHQPLAVVADTDTLLTLPDRQLRAGLAEVIKYGCIWDPLLFEWLELNIDRLLRRDAEALAYAIGRSCEIKAAVVGRDERESHVRAILNFGHTFGHAIESATHYATYLHGEAVGLGMLMAASLSHRLGWLDAIAQARIRDLLDRAGLPTEPPLVGAARAFELMQMDKKVLSGTVRLVLLESLGRAVVTGTYGQPALNATLAEFFA